MTPTGHQGAARSVLAIALIFSPSNPLLARKSILQIAGKDCGCLQGRPIVLVPASDFCLANGGSHCA
jgi:hypothetical protein